MEGVAFRVAGRFGVDPVFNMTKPKTADNGTTRTETVTQALDGSFTRVSETSTKVNQKCKQEDGKEVCEPISTPARPEFSSAFVWDIGGDLNVPFFSDATELTFWGRAGQAFSLQDVVADKDKGVQVFADFDTNSRWYFDYGARLVLYPDGYGSRVARRLAAVRPAADLVWGARTDRRLKGVAGFEHPERRQFVRLTLSRLPVFGLDGNKAVDLSFAVEHEWSFNGGKLPSGTRFYLQGTIDPKKAF
jgi:hypothetical protein